MYSLLPRLNVLPVAVGFEVIPEREAEGCVRVGITEGEEVLTRDLALFATEFSMHGHAEGLANEWIYLVVKIVVPFVGVAC